MSGWWFQPTPLKNDGVRQLGLLFPIWKVIKFHGSKPPTRCHIIDPSHRHWPVQTAFYDVLCGFNPPKTIRCWYVPRHLAALIWMLPPYVPLQCEAILLIGKPDNFAEFVASDSTEPWENHHFSRPLPWTSCPCQAYLLWTYHLPCHVAAFNRALKLPKSHTAVLDSEARQTCGQSRSVLYVSKTPWQLAIHSICGICLISFFWFIHRMATSRNIRWIGCICCAGDAATALLNLAWLPEFARCLPLCWTENCWLLGSEVSCGKPIWTGYIYI